MSPVLSMAMKDLRLLARDRMSLFFVALFPVIYGIFFGAIGSSMGGEGSAGFTIAAVDLDNSPQSQAFIADLDALETLTVVEAGAEEARNRVRTGSLTAFVVIPEGFGETAGILWETPPALEVGIDPSRKAESGMLQGLILQAMAQQIQARFTDPAALTPSIQQSLDEIRTASDEELPPAQKFIITTFLSSLTTFLNTVDLEAMGEADGEGGGMPSMEPATITLVDVTRENRYREVTEKLRSPWDISFPSAMLWGVVGTAAGFAVSLVREQTIGTLARLRAAPISAAQLLASKALACFLTMLACLGLMTAIGYAVGLRVDSVPLYLLAVFCTSLGFVGIMMLLSTLGRTEQAVGGAGWAILVIMCMIGGGMIPLAFMPSFMQTLSHFSPVKWGILTLEGAIWRGFSLTEMLAPCAIMLAYGGVCFLLGLWMMRSTFAR